MATVGLDPLEVALSQVDAAEFSLFQCLMDIVDRRLYQVELSVDEPWKVEDRGEKPAIAA
jgi:hypothetical protein